MEGGGGGSFPVMLHAACLLFWWKWAPSWMFLKYLASFIIYFVDGCFWGTVFSDCFNILRTLFILTLQGKKVLWKALFAGELLINAWYCISYLLNINYALMI